MNQTTIADRLTELFVCASDEGSKRFDLDSAVLTITSLFN